MAIESSAISSVSPWLSILLPVYNVERYLQECMESILTQDTAGVEIIALDDVSTDGSLALLTKLQATWGAAFSVMQHSENQGISEARNSLLCAAKGYYIWFVDSDDMMKPNAVAELKEVVDREGPDLVLCDYELYYDGITPKHPSFNGEKVSTFAGLPNKKMNDVSELVVGLFHDGLMHTCTKISKLHLWLDDLLFPRGKFFQDSFTMPVLAIRAKTYYYTPRAWVVYRQRPGSIQATMSLAKMTHYTEAYIGFADEFYKIEPNPSLAAKFKVSYKCARAFITFARYASYIACVEELQTVDLTTFRDNFIRSSMMPLKELRREFLKRGWFRRWLKLSIWLNFASKPRKVIGRQSHKQSKPLPKLVRRSKNFLLHVVGADVI